MSKRIRSRAALVALAALAVPACRITPDEIARIEAENELLREQISAMRFECEQYRRIDLDVEQPGEAREGAAPEDAAPEGGAQEPETTEPR